MYRTRNTATGLVLNRHGNVKVTPKKGDALSVYEDTGSNDQRFEMVRKGDFVYFVLASNKKLVINRHSQSGALMLWPLAESTMDDILFNTETTADGVRLIMPAHNAYVTAPYLYSGGNVITESNPEHNGTQYFVLEEADDGKGSAQSDGGTASTGKELAVPYENQMQWGGTYCLAATLLGLCKFYGHNITMNTLITKGCVRKSDGFVNTPAPYVSWTRTGYNLDESAYCAAITQQINQGAPVVLQIASTSAGTHYITCIAGGKNADEVKVIDPMLGKVTLRAAIKRKGQTYQHMRTTKKL